MQFKLDGANLGAEDTSSPYSATWDTTTAPTARHTLTAVARDAAEQHDHADGDHRHGQQPAATRPAPAVSITAPADGATVSGRRP